MVNASLNWASITGIILTLFGIIAAPTSIAQIIFVLNRRAENNKASITRSIFILVMGFGRCIGSLLVGGILFFQGWRLEPVFQFAFLILVVGLIIESSSGVLKDRKEWSGRKNTK
tara:strand:- start:225 stop:569 length:345 start_codon:yes stop_codon:yes gene_type:complete